MPFIGLNGKFTALLSGNYGLIITDTTDKAVLSFPKGETPYKLAKVCWDDSLAVLVANYVYFISFTSNFYFTQHNQTLKLM